MNSNHFFMQRALNLAEEAKKRGEVPVGAVVVLNNETIIGEGFNERESLQLPTAHAEVLAIQRASQHLKSWRLNNCTLIVTKEPCLMCAGASMLSRLDKVIFGCWDKRFGASYLLQEASHNHHCTVEGGVREEECAQVLKDFFAKLRGKT